VLNPGDGVLVCCGGEPVHRSEDGLVVVLRLKGDPALRGELQPQAAPGSVFFLQLQELISLSVMQALAGVIVNDPAGALGEWGHGAESFGPEGGVSVIALSGVFVNRVIT